MKRTIKVVMGDLDSIQQAIKDVDKFKKDFQKRVDKFMHILAYKGANFARAEFSGGASYGNDDVTVKAEKVGKRAWKITASGEDVYFVEFGAGIGTDPTDPFVAQADVEVWDGSYSMMNNGPYFRKGSWFYNWQELNGVQAFKPMYKTHKELEERLFAEAVSEVFGYD